LIEGGSVYLTYTKTRGGLTGLAISCVETVI